MRFVFVGDYIDRGPDSRGVIEHVMALQQRLGDSVVTLMGNHEAMVLAIIDETISAGAWLTEGGIATLRMSYDDGRRLFVHAGINPEKALDAQDDEDLLWIREP